MSAMDGVVVPRRRAPKRKGSFLFAKSNRAKVARTLKILRADDELKWHDQVQTIVPVFAGDVGSSFIAAIDRGTDPDQRIGRKITVHSVSLKGRLTNGTNATGQFGMGYRMVMFYDKQPNGGDPGVTDVMTTASIHSHKNLSADQRFVILADRTFTCNNEYAGLHYYPVSFYKAFKTPLNIEYKGNAGTVADLSTGNINCIWFSEADPATTSNAFTGISRIRFRG